MAQPTPSLGDKSSEPAQTDTPRSLREYVKTTVINALPPVIAYYVLRALGLAPYLALAGAIVVAVAQGLVAAVRKRRFEPVNGLVILGAACSLTIAFATKNPRIVQVLELIPASLLVWSFLASGLLGKPASKKMAGAIAPQLADGALPGRGWTEQDIHDWHQLHTWLCRWLGLLCGAFPAVAVPLIFALPVDVSLVLINSIGPALLVLSVAIAIALLRRFVHQRDQAAAERSRQHTETASPESP